MAPLVGLLATLIGKALAVIYVSPILADMNRSPRSPSTIPYAPARSGGFTLIELMVTLSVLVVLVTIAVPMFRGVTQRNALTAEVNNFVGGLNFARTEAVTRGRNVLACASSNQTSCNGDPNAGWADGWIVYLPATPGSSDVGTVLKVFSVENRNVAIAANGSGAISFNSSGFAGTGRTATFRTADGSRTRDVVIAASGRIQAQGS